MNNDINKPAGLSDRDTKLIRAVQAGEAVPLEGTGPGGGLLADPVVDTGAVAPDAVVPIDALAPDTVVPVGQLAPDEIHPVGTLAPDLVLSVDELAPDAIVLIETLAPDPSPEDPVLDAFEAWLDKLP